MAYLILRTSQFAHNSTVVEVIENCAVHRQLFLSTRQHTTMKADNRDQPIQQDHHDFTKIPEFDQAMRVLVNVPKTEVVKREAEEKTPRTPKC